MKKLIALVFLGLNLLSASAFAQVPPPSAAPAPGGAPSAANKGEHPCHQIRLACEAAGFVKGGHKGGDKKGLWKDCFEPLMAGQAVPGVNVTPATIQECQAKKATYHRK